MEILGRPRACAGVVASGAVVGAATGVDVGADVGDDVHAGDGVVGNCVGDIGAGVVGDVVGDNGDKIDKDDIWRWRRRCWRWRRWRLCL